VLARDRRVSFVGQVLVRPARTGPLVLDAEYDPDVLRHVSVLKLAEEEARVLVGEPEAEALASLGVPEILVTFGSEGSRSLVFADGRLEPVPARALRTGRPDRRRRCVLGGYLVSRSTGYAPARGWPRKRARLRPTSSPGGS
jgi:hypothetical protein